MCLRRSHERCWFLLENERMQRLHACLVRFLQQQNILARQRTLKTFDKVTGTGAAIGALGRVLKLCSITRSSQMVLWRITGS
jgi:hypothetical protein